MSSSPQAPLFAIDIGNTRLKWGCYKPGTGWLAQGALALAQVQDLAPLLTQQPELPHLALMANVAGQAIGAQVAHILAQRGLPCHLLRAQAVQCGVRNGYEQPAALGADRWAALIAARASHDGPCLVVMAGTATTVDVLDGSGQFQGGLILPGLSLMRASLARDTAQLQLAPGQVCRHPRNTADAIMSGCVDAQAGAIERMYGRLDGNALCLLAGGAAPSLAPHLNIPLRLADNLVLDGLAQVGLSLQDATD